MNRIDESEISDFLHSNEAEGCQNLTELYKMFYNKFRSKNVGSMYGNFTQFLTLRGGLTPQEIVDDFHDGNNFLLPGMFNGIEYGEEFDLVLPDNITIIRNFDFSGSIRLKAISGKNVTEIRESSFSNCRYLESINFPLLKTIPSFHTFAYCKKLKNISLDKVEKIGRETFYQCFALASVYLPNLVEIPYDSFAECPNTTLYLPKKIIEKLDSDSYSYLSRQVLGIKEI